MTLTELVPTLDLCQQLRDKGFPQDTALQWYPTLADDGESKGGGGVVWPSDLLSKDALCAAPTAGELEEWLLCHDCDNILITNESADGENAVGVSCIHSDGRDFEAHEATEIEAKAALVLEVAG